MLIECGPRQILMTMSTKKMLTRTRTHDCDIARSVYRARANHMTRHATEQKLAGTILRY